MRQTTRRRYEPDGAVLVKVRARRRAFDHARNKVQKAEGELSAALLEAASVGWTMRELAEVSELTLSSVYRRIAEAEQAS